MSLPPRWLVSSTLLAGLLAGCNSAESVTPRPAPTTGRVITLKPGPQDQENTQTALIKARPGDTIEFAEGTFEFTQSLSLTVENVTLRGQGMDKTTLSFKKQTAGTEGLLVTRGKFRIQDLSVEDAKGDGIKVNDAENVVFQRVRAQWSGGEKETNGAYGLYPVQCKNVLIEECVAIGASDAGIYVGQSTNVVVRKCRAERNVAGIEIENCTDADVYENVATNNAGGLLVFDLPGLPVKNGKRVRVHHNQVVANNHANFAPKGNVVASVAPGTGTMILATDQVEMFANTIRENNTSSLAVISFYMTGRPIEDKEYDPIPEGIFVHDNTFADGGTKPAGERGQFLQMLLGVPIPDMIYDGVENPARQSGGKRSAEYGVFFKNSGKATFANLHLKLAPKDPLGFQTQVSRDLKSQEGELPPLSPVALPGGLE